jgi:hypothetical protein
VARTLGWSRDQPGLELDGRKGGDTVRELRLDPALEKEWIRQNGLIYGGLIAGGGLMLQPFLVASSLDLTATISVVAFAVAIPLLAALWLIGQQETFRRRPVRSTVVNVTKIVAQATGFLWASWPASGTSPRLRESRSSPPRSLRRSSMRRPS